METNQIRALYPATDLTKWQPLTTHSAQSNKSLYGTVCLPLRLTHILRLAHWVFAHIVLTAHSRYIKSQSGNMPFYQVQPKQNK